MTYSGRFIDAAEEPLTSLGSISDSNEASSESLDEALRRVRRYVNRLDEKIKAAKDNSYFSKGRLTIDEAAAIQLYTMESKDWYESVSTRLNLSLRSEQRLHMQFWLDYLKLFLRGLKKLPSSSGTIYRLALGNLANQYPKECTWWGFSSCTTDPSFLEKHIDQHNDWTVFRIKCINGKDIRRFSYCPEQSEIILLPGAHFRVVGVQKLETSLHRIDLEETGTPQQLFTSFIDQSSSNYHQPSHHSTSNSNTGQSQSLFTSSGTIR